MFLKSILAAVLFFLVYVPMSEAQSMAGFNRQRNREMLRTIKDQIVKSYFDPTFRGVDLEARFLEADRRLQNATNDTDSFIAIMEFLENLKDSHTRFIPPARRDKYRHGWLMQMIGDKCYVVEVLKGSDAEKKGLKPGDRIVEIERLMPTRSEFARITYFLYALNPLPDFNLVIETPSGERKTLRVDAKKTSGKAVIDLNDYNSYMNLVRQAETQSKLGAHRFIEFGSKAVVWKMPRFDMPIHQVDDMIGKVRSKETLVLDLRGNGGGDEEMLLRLVGHLFPEKDLKIGDITRRKETTPLVARSMGDRGFRGKLVVMIDADSASAAEVLARVVQLNDRGRVIGDRSSGRVMRSMYYPQKYGFDVFVAYGVTVTDADLIMTDGGRLEGGGVVPDEVMIPTPEDLRGALDPVLAHALSLAGVEVTPQKAGAMFPFLWK